MPLFLLWPGGIAASADIIFRSADPLPCRAAAPTSELTSGCALRRQEEVKEVQEQGFG